MKKLLPACVLLIVAVISFVIIDRTKADIKKSASTDNTKKKTILFIAGGQSHGTGQHEHRAGCLLLIKALKESGLNVNLKLHALPKGRANIWPKDKNIFAGIDTAVIYADAAGRMDVFTLANIQKEVERGMGLVFIHYGVHPSSEIGDKYFTNWIGGYFHNDISVNPHWFATVKPNANHPVKNGIEKIEAHDEWYYNMKFNPEHQVLASALLEEKRVTRYNNIWNKPGDDQFGKHVALMWANKPKNDQASRGVGFTGGHYHQNWAIDNFRKLVLNAIVWTAKIPVPENGVSSKPLTVEDLNKNLDGFPANQVVTKVKMPTITLDKIEPDTRPPNPETYQQWRRKQHELAKKLREAKKKAEEAKKAKETEPVQ